MEYMVIIAIGVLVLMIISYAIGVERGKRLPVDRVVSAEQATLSEEKTEDFVITHVEKIVEESSFDEEVKAQKEREAALLAGKEEEKAAASQAVKEAVPPAPSAYVIQLASFKKKSSADEEIDRLRRKGVDARIARKGEWYQVYASGYNTIEEARRARAGLMEDYPDCYIRKTK